MSPFHESRRNQYVTAVAVFVAFAGFAFVLPFLPMFVRELGVADADKAALWAGVLIGVAPLLAGLLGPFWGRLADRFGRKPVALLMLSAYVVLLLLSAFVSHVVQLLALRIGIGLFGGFGPLGLAMATSGLDRDQTGRAVGMVQAAQILAAAIGPLAGGWLAEAIGIRATFVVTAALCSGVALLVAGYYSEAPHPEGEAAGRTATTFKAILRLPGVPLLLVVLFLVNFIGRSFTPILPLYLSGLGVLRLAFCTGLLISAYSLAAALSASWLGRATRRRSPRGMLTASLVAGAATVLPMASVPSFGYLLALAVLLGLASGGALTLCYTIGGLMVPERHRATAYGFLSGAALLGGAVSPSFAGLLAHWDVRGIFWLDAALFAFAALILSWGALRRAPQTPARSRE